MDEIGWHMSEVIGIGFVNRNLELARGDMTRAREMVAAGEARLVHAHATTLLLAPPDYELRMWEWFLTEEAPGRFVKTS